ncbi:MAG: hypothetical protein WBC33_08450 [Conexibacter sp.]
MRKLTQLALMACVAFGLLAFAAGTASAERAIEIRPTEVVNMGRIALTYNEEMRRGIITCELTISLRYVRVIQKVWARRLFEGRIGIIPGVRAAGCREMMNNFNVIFLATAENPIAMRYDAFLGTLPLITGLLVTALEVGVRIRSAGANCLFQGDLPFLAFENGGGQSFNRKTFLANNLPWVEGMPCPAGSSIEISGTLTIDPPIGVALL